MGYKTATRKVSNKVATTSEISNGTSMEVCDSGVCLERKQASPNYQDGKFVNPFHTDVIKEGATWHTFKNRFFGGYTSFPPLEIPIKPLLREDFRTPKLQELRAIWFGHSCVLIEIDGIRLLVDPVFSRAISPVIFLRPKRFHPPPIALADLPEIDAVMISHDHHDHLDKKVIQYLAERGTFFLVPLGIGAYLKKWKIRESQIIELDWWESSTVGRVRLICTPAIHFSGRNLFDFNRTLWSSWAIIGANCRVFFSGDTGYSDHFQEIGNRFGPFELTLMKVGGYGPYWPDIHLTPEQAIDAHLDLRGQHLLPVHWCTYDLSLHDWDEPIKRTVKAARQKNVDLITPHIGEIVDTHLPFASSRWWEKIK